MTAPVPSAPPTGSAPAPRPRARRRRWFALVLVAFVLALLAAALELALRIFWVPPDLLGPVLAAPQFWAPAPDEYEPLPGYTGAFLAQAPDDLPAVAKFESRVLPLRLNSIGLRGPELGPRQPGERRVLFVGDSMVFGHLVDESECFAARAAAALTATLGRPVTACNAGFPGYGFAAAGKRMRRLLPVVDADAAVAGLFLGNDFLDDQKQLHVAVVAGRLFDGPWANLMHASWRGPLLVRSRLWLWLENALVQCAPSWSVLPYLQAPQLAGFPGLGRQTVAGLYLDAIDEQRTWRPGTPPLLPRLFLHLRDTLAGMQRDAGPRPLLVVVLPTLYHLDPDLYAATLRDVDLVPAEYRPGLSQQRVLALCRQLGVAALDLTPALRADPAPTSLFHEDKAHFSVKGNRLVGELVAQRLAALLH